MIRVLPIFSIRELSLDYQTPAVDPVPEPVIDVQRPHVSITLPANDTTVSGTINIVATATDNVAIASVQFNIDGVNTGPAIPGPGPYIIPWDTLQVENGTHQLLAIATDTSGNVGLSAFVDVTVFNLSKAFCNMTSQDLTGLGTEFTLMITNLGSTDYDSSIYKVYNLETNALLQTPLRSVVHAGETEIVILNQQPGTPPNGFYMTVSGVTFFTYPGNLNGHNVQIRLDVNC